VKTDSCYECAERRQLDFIQRVGRVGYWEYDPTQRAMTLPDASLDLLASIAGAAPGTYRTLLDALGETERKRFAQALDQAASLKQTLKLQLKLASVNSHHAHVVVRGAPVELGESATILAGTFEDITQDKHRDVEHETVITQLQALLDALPQGVSVVDKDLKLILWNQRLHEILDIPQRLLFRNAAFDDLIRLNAERGDYGPGDPDEQVRAIVERARQFLPHRFERQLPGGRTVLVEGFPFRSGGEISGFVTTYMDITDQKKSEEQLTRQRDVMKTVIDNFPGAISLCDTDLRFTTYNEQFLTLLDFPPHLFAKGWVDFEDLVRYNVNRGEYGPGDPEEQVRTSVERAHNFQAHRIERQRPNGRWLEIRGTPIPSGGFVTSYLDITERKQAEEALRESEERWNFALEGSNDGVWDWNVQTGQAVYSKRWKELFGYAESEFSNTTAEWSKSVHPDDWPELWGKIKRHLHGEAPPPSVEYRFRCKDGSWKWTLGRGMVVSRDAAGKPMRLVGTNSDITERKLIEAELVHSKEVAEMRREQVASLLDNSGQGFLSFGVDLVVQAACSRACETMLGQYPAGQDVSRLLFGEDEAKAELLRAIIPSVLAQTDPDTRESMLSLLPSEIHRDHVILKAEYRILDNDQFMLVLTDITAERRMAAMLERERHRLELIVKAVSDSRSFFETVDGFLEFLTQGLPRLLQADASPQSAAKELYREIHTFKGLLNQFSFPTAPAALHDTESRLSALLSQGEALDIRQLSDAIEADALQTAFNADLAVLSDTLGEEFLVHGETFVLSEPQARRLEELATRMLRGEPVDTADSGTRTLLQELGTLRKVSFSEVLLGYDRLVKQAAQRLDKEVAPIEVHANTEVWIDPAAYRPFLRSLVHVFVNAVAHGIETPEGRWEAEKGEVGKIRCSIELEDNTIRLSVADDGRGIDLDALRLRAVAAGIHEHDEVHSIPDDDIAHLVFRDNISTQQTVNTLAGRGVGLAVVLNETRNLGGQVTVETVPGQGTRFLFTLPLQQDESQKEVQS